MPKAALITKPQKPEMQTILSVGEDPSLLSIRGLVLATTGAAVSSVTPAQGLLLLTTSTFDLLVFCHSVRESDILKLCAATRGWGSSPRTLLLEVPGATFRPRAEMDSRHSLEAGPGLLVKQVRALLGGEEPDPVTGEFRLIPFASAWRYEVTIRICKMRSAPATKPGHRGLPIMTSPSVTDSLLQ